MAPCIIKELHSPIEGHMIQAVGNANKAALSQDAQGTMKINPWRRGPQGTCLPIPVSEILDDVAC